MSMETLNKNGLAMIGTLPFRTDIALEAVTGGVIRMLVNTVPGVIPKFPAASETSCLLPKLCVCGRNQLCSESQQHPTISFKKQSVNNKQRQVNTKQAHAL